LHYEFGAAHKAIFFAAYSMFLIDTFVYQSIIQFCILAILLGYIHIYARAKEVSPRITRKMLRAMQISSYIFIFLAFVLRMPDLFDNFEKDNQRWL